jgi:hypothetical protein
MVVRISEITIPKAREMDIKLMRDGVISAFSILDKYSSEIPVKKESISRLQSSSSSKQ